MSKSMVRSVKNVTKGYSSVQVKVRNATSNDAWGPSGTEMSEIAQMTYNNSSDFYEIMDMLDKRMNDKGKNWRHVLKSLKVLDYCLHEGSELVVTWARKNIYIIKTLREFQYIDEEGRDVGQNVRLSAKELTSLVLDEERLRAERHDRKLWKQRVTGLDDGYGNAGPSSPRRPPRRERQNDDDDDLEYKLAIEASKNQEEEDKRRRGGGAKAEVGEEDDLAKAIKLSKEEEELRRRELEESNANNNLLDFDNTPSQPTQPQATGFNNGYQQQGAVDWFGNPLASQQTGMLNNAYSQPTGAQPMQTGFQNGYNGYNQLQQQPQQQFNQYQQPQQQQMQPQQTAFNMNNPYSQQNPNFSLQQQQPQQPVEQQPTAQPGSNNPWASNNQNAFDSMKPMQTGSNNPFSTSVKRPQTASAAQRQPTLDTLQEQRQQNTFNQFSSMSLNNQQPPMPPLPTQTQQMQPAQAMNQGQDYKSNLNQLLATGDGQDTFGNTGDLRIPAQHTAPGTYINSAGHGASKLNATQTGNNPFMQNQFTGMPAPQYPAQTGPAGNFGSSPFGQSQSNPYGQRQNQQGGNLIDF